MNYEEHFGTEWARLSFDEALLRAFALGIADMEGMAPEDEFDRLRSTASSRYELQLIETAFIEGRHIELRDGEHSEPIHEDTLPEFIKQLDIDISALLSDTQSSLAGYSVPLALTRIPVQGNDVPRSHDLSLPDMLRGVER